jgi:D-xylose 1-dehydrogenase (NADP+, D-xylono-1,5-lactone-forming)
VNKSNNKKIRFGIYGCGIYVVNVRVIINLKLTTRKAIFRRRYHLKERIRWGVLGTARIAHDYTVPAINQSRNGKVVAIAGRSETKVAQFAKDLGIPKTYLGYEKLLDSPDIDAVYIPLTNDLHARWTIESARTKKHVLCEKPAALTSRSCIEMISECKANRVNFMEAFMYRFHPQYEILRKEIDSGNIGKVCQIRTGFWFKFSDLSDIRYQKETGGGALWDLGCYCVNGIRLIMQSEPVFVSATSKFHGTEDVDEITIGIMRFEDSRFASFDCGFLGPLNNSLHIVGSEGVIEMPEAFEYPQNPKLIVYKGNSVIPSKVINVEKANPYKIMAEHFADCILRNKTPIYEPYDAVNNTKVLESILQSSRSRINS